MTARKSFLLRIDPALFAELERLAQVDLRSVNAEVEYLLRDALARLSDSLGLPREAPLFFEEANKEERKSRDSQ